ncbi:UshA-like (seleno)protein [Haliangium sp.]|uniref:UshA-like (seleno)protein n=1 Tax=Haliangium sp. TaxID=2663208 RepID=UPI003D0F7F70
MSPRPACLWPALALVLAACSASSTSKKTPEAEPQRFTLFVTTEMRGQIEPCGCSTNPLGDLARTVEMIDDTRRSGRAVLVVDGGSLLFSSVPVPEHLDAQERGKAELLVRTYTERLEAAAIGLGPNDLGRGVAAVTPPRHAANLSADSGIPLEPPELVDIGGVRVGVFGVVAPAALSALDITAGDPAEAARTAIADLRRRGARLIVGLAHMTRREAADLARSAPGIDVLVVGQNAPADPTKVSPVARRVGDTYLVRPADRGQVVTRLDITVRGDSGALVDAIGEARAQVEIASADEQIERLRAELGTWRADPSADPAFVQAKEQELGELEQRRARLQKNPVQAPEDGSWFVMTQVEIKKSLACDADIQAAKAAHSRAAGKANLAAAEGKQPPPAPPGTAGYAGAEECSYCHAEAIEFWHKTKHFQAWETLEARDKQFDYECIGCHVTGWDRPGGANLAVNEHLRDVQCEVCHGPGSLHIEADGEDSPKTVTRTPPETLCVGCHNHEHSDTFDYAAYLRDVTGPGHGEAFRAQLGDGPTGGELRRAGLEKAGAALGEGCVK